MKEGLIETYVEPFVGGGAVYFYVNNSYAFDECHIYDINEELVLAYSVVKNDVEELIEILRDVETTYLSLEPEKKEKFFYETRNRYNELKRSIQWYKYDKTWIQRAADLIFLNRTCFNGLYRVNSKGEFNVPFGRYKNPKYYMKRYCGVIRLCLKIRVYIRATSRNVLNTSMNIRSFTLTRHTDH